MRARVGQLKAFLSYKNSPYPPTCTFVSGSKDVDSVQYTTITNTCTSILHVSYMYVMHLPPEPARQVRKEPGHFKGYMLTFCMFDNPCGVCVFWCTLTSGGGHIGEW